MSQWINYKEQKPTEEGYYLVYTGSSKRVQRFKDGNFYKTYYQISKIILYWMEIPEIPCSHRRKKSTLANHLFMCSPKGIELLNNAGIITIDDLLKKSKEELFAIKGLKHSMLRRFIDSLDSYFEIPESWGDEKELCKASEYSHKQLKYYFGLDDIPAFRRCYFSPYDRDNQIELKLKVGLHLAERYKETINYLKNLPNYIDDSTSFSWTQTLITSFYFSLPEGMEPLT